jgi:hypothetical protein
MSRHTNAPFSNCNQKQSIVNNKDMEKNTKTQTPNSFLLSLLKGGEGWGEEISV